MPDVHAPATLPPRRPKSPLCRPAGFTARRICRAAVRGFTLVEVMIVVLVISVLTMLAVPQFARIKRKAKTTAILNDFRVFAAAFDTYSHERGDWPPEAAAGVVPAGMAPYLNSTAWRRITPMGGQYNWENNQVHFGVRYRAAISITGTTGAPLALDVNQLTDLEEAIDGKGLDWLGGSFRIGTGLVPLFIVQP